eukprot:2365905-Pyramimonas_sp.AAC.1
MEQNRETEEAAEDEERGAGASVPDACTCWHRGNRAWRWGRVNPRVRKLRHEMCNPSRSDEYFSC